MRTVDILVVTPFRRPGFRHAISPSHPFEEPVDSPSFVAAAACAQAGYETAVLALQNIYAGYDERADADELADLVRAYAPRLVLFSSDHFIASRSTATRYGIEMVARILRGGQYPGGGTEPALVGVTGRLVTTAGRALLAAVPEIDFAVIGEAEEVLGDTVTAALRKGMSGVAGLPHVLTRDGPDPEPAFVVDPDALPLPAFHLAGPSVERIVARRASRVDTVAFSLRTSYGCKFRCKFCAGVPHWTDYRTKSGGRMAAEIDHLYASVPGARLAFLEDEIATRSVGHVRALADVLGVRKLRLDGVYTHASLVTDEVARLLAPVVDRIFLGLDNPHDDLLRAMGKGQRLDTVLAAVRRARAAGLGTHLEWIIGSPPETVDTLVTSLHAIFSLLATGAVDSINTYVYCPHPGTEYAVRAADHDLTVHDPFDMLESGGYPAGSTPRLSRNQIFTAYLMSQLLIAEASQARRHTGPLQVPRAPVRAELHRLFTTIGGT